MLQSLAPPIVGHALLFAGAEPRRALHIIGGDFMEIAAGAADQGFFPPSFSCLAAA
jgi:hypothetical protein